MTTKTFDITPTWSGILPVLAAALQNGTAEGQRMAMEELKRMAQLADPHAQNIKSEEGGAK